MFYNDSETIFGKPYPDWYSNGGTLGAMQIGEKIRAMYS